MSSLSDFARSRETPAKGWTPEIISNGQEAMVVTKAYDTDQTHDELMTEAGYPPEQWELDGPMAFTRRELDSGEVRISYRFRVKKRRGSVELSALFTEVREEKKRNTTAATGFEPAPDRALVVVMADVQAGKVDSRGGLKELTERLEEKNEKLGNEARRRGCGQAFFLDAGDSIEGFENVKAQQFTNALSLTDQVEYVSIVEEKFIKTLADTHPQVTVAGIPSNHAQWREGKSLNGKPSDDWGLFVLRSLKRAFQTNPDVFGHVSFYEPETWDETLVLDVVGTMVGLAHGHQAKVINSVPNWWAQQTHGAQPLAWADVLVTGHFHSLRIQPTGRSMRTRKSKYWLACPTLDNGSSWYRNTAGADEDPGMLIFEIGPEGFDLTSLSIL